LRFLCIAIIFNLLISGSIASANEILVVQSLRVKPFDEAFSGFKSVCEAESKKVVISESEGVDILRTVREEQPKLILAIGADALNRLKGIRNTPILYLMVLNPQKISGGSNVTGVTMNIPPENYLNIIKKLDLPKTRVGILYDQANNGSTMKKILQAARSRGIEMTAREVHRPKEVPDLLAKMKDSFNVYLMLPDPTVVTPEAVEFLFLFTQQNRIPVITFAGKYLDIGALISLEIDSFDLGKQAGEMANMLLAGGSVAELPKAEPRKVIIRFNGKVAKKLGFDLDVLGAVGLPKSD
jgi:putative tryptophan/tyrosine transport system substrate-binding protein